MRDSSPSRRSFLQAMVVGGAAAATGLADSFLAAPAARAAATDGIETFEGILTGVASRTAALQLGVEERLVSLDAVPRLWRLGDRPLSALAVGDSVLVRAESGVVRNLWANLNRVAGTVTDISSGQVAIATDAGARSVALAPDATYVDLSNGQAMSTPAIRVGTYLDVIGYTADDPSDITGTLVSIYNSAIDAVSNGISGPDGGIDASMLSLADNTHDTVSIDSLPNSCTYTYYGIATWFNCATGGGACGTCSTSLNNQLAWPAKSSSCACCNSSCCQCSAGCKNQVVIGCGKAVTVTSMCGGNAVCAVADCGPRQKANCTTSTSVCGHACSKCGSRSTPIVDLTKPTFTRFFNPASYGCFSASARVTVPC
jgi:hypothetical protein